MEKSAWEIVEEKIPNIKIYLILIAIIFVAYVNILPNGFLWDDNQQIVYNQFIQTPGNLTEILLSDTSISGFHGLQRGFYRPLQNFSYWFLFQIFGLNAWGFHLFQLLLHIANAFLVFFVVREILKVAGTKYSEKISFLTAAFFAVHPGISEAVQYSAAIGEPLFGLFALLSFYQLLHGIDYDSKTIKTRNIIWATIFGFFAFASKESAAAIFVFGVLYLFFFLKPKMKTYARYLAGGFIATFAYLYLRFSVAKIAVIASDQPVPIDKASLAERIRTIPLELATYFKIIFWPARLQIYQNFVVRNASFFDFWLPLGILVILLLLFFIWTVYQPPSRRKLGLLFFLGYGLFIFPVLNIIPLSMTLAERWLYFPSIFLFSLILLIMFSFIEKKEKYINVVASILLIVAIPALMVRTVIRDGNWRNELALCEHDIRYTKEDNANLENNYGNELMRVGKVAEAKTHFERSIALMGDWTVSQNNLGAIYDREGDFEKAKSYFQKSIDLGDNYAAYQNMINVLLYRTKQKEEARDFIANHALIKFPYSADFHVQLAMIEYRKGNKADAKKLVEQAMDLDPQNAKTRELYTAMQNNMDIEF